MPTDRDLHQRAVDATTALVDGIEPADLDRPTPCTGWDLRALLEHMVGQNHGFAAAVIDPDTPASAFAPRAPDGWARSAAALTAAFAAAPLEREVVLAELHPTRRLPVAVVIRIHLLDTVVHAWDVATALGRTYRPDDELLAATVEVSRLVPDGGRDEPGAAFGPVVRSQATGDAWSALLARLGRA